MTEPVSFTLPKKPRVQEKDAPPDQRKFVVIPIRAATDKQLTQGMTRALLLICSYMNRSGITWVSQAKLAADMGVTQQAISKHLVKLTKAGYLEVLRKAVPNERHTTWRVIFDPSISAEDAVSITSSIEDTRPPYMKQEQQMDTTPDPVGQARIASLIAKALKNPQPKKEPPMSEKNETRTVKQMKEEIAKTKARRTKKPPHAQPPEVVHQAQPPAVDKSLHAQPLEVVEPTTSGGCTEHTKNTLREDIYKHSVLHNLNEVQRAEIAAAGVTDAEAASCLQTLTEVYAAEGLTPHPERLAAEVISLAAIGRGIA